MVPPIPEEDLLEDLRRVADILGKPPSGNDYDEYGEYSASAIYNHFDGIRDARKQAGIDGSDQRGGHNEVEREDLLRAIHDLADELGRTPRQEEMLNQGDYSEGPFRRTFGSWGDAVVAAGYEPHRPNADLAETVEMTCANCGVTETELASQVEAQSRWFCGRACKHEWQAENVVGEAHHQYAKVTVQCDWCGEEIERKPAVLENREHVFCGHECYGEWCSEERVEGDHPRWSGGETTLECEYCGDEYEVRAAKADDSRFCSRGCLAEVWKAEYAGDGNPNWGGGYEPYYGPNWRQQREARMERDGNQCVVCGIDNETHLQKYGFDLSVHHVTPFTEFVNDAVADYEQANRLENLRTMCKDCHHRWEGVPVAPE